MLIVIAYIFVNMLLNLSKLFYWNYLSTLLDCSYYISRFNFYISMPSIAHW